LPHNARPFLAWQFQNVRHPPILSPIQEYIATLFAIILLPLFSHGTYFWNSLRSIIQGPYVHGNSKRYVTPQFFMPSKITLPPFFVTTPFSYLFPNNSSIVVICQSSLLIMDYQYLNPTSFPVGWHFLTPPKRFAHSPRESEDSSRPIISLPDKTEHNAMLDKNIDRP
jgi:hypothetical protein